MITREVFWNIDVFQQTLFYGLSAVASARVAPMVVKLLFVVTPNCTRVDHASSGR